MPSGEVYTILDSVHGQGHYVGVSMGWGVNTNGWWGEGEIKFYIDGDDEFPTICGTGTEDYFGGGAGWIVDDAYATYSTPFLGMQQVIKPDGFSKVEHRHSLYRFHVMDPVRFEQDLRVDDAGARLAGASRVRRHRRGLPAGSRRRQLGVLLVSDLADRAVPPSCPSGSS